MNLNKIKNDKVIISKDNDREDVEWILRKKTKNMTIPEDSYREILAGCICKEGDKCGCFGKKCAANNKNGEVAV